jgi:hypothetical protein
MLKHLTHSRTRRSSRCLDVHLGREGFDVNSPLAHSRSSDPLAPAPPLHARAHPSCPSLWAADSQLACTRSCGVPRWSWSREADPGAGLAELAAVW